MRSVAVAALLAMSAVLVAGGPQGAAIVPPKNCKTMTVAGKRYTIKADQLRCSTARRYAQRYLAHHRRPSGYSCRDFDGSTKLKFRCSRGIRVFFAIRR
jgi:hypothetical protein